MTSKDFLSISNLPSHIKQCILLGPPDDSGDSYYDTCKCSASDYCVLWSTDNGCYKGVIACYKEC